MENKTDSNRGPQMNACMIAYTFYTLDQRVRRYAEALVDANNRVDAIALKSSRIEKTYETLNGVNVHRIIYRHKSEQKWYDYFAKVLLFFIIGSIVLFFKQLRHRYRVIHVHNVPDYLVFMALLPKLAGAKIILDIHDILPEFFCQKFHRSPHSTLAKVLRFMERISVRFADHVIVANDLWRKKLIERNGIPEDRCTTILNYPNLKLFTGHPRRTSGDDITVIYPGTVSHLHGIDIAIKAMHKAKETMPNVRLHIYAPIYRSSYHRYLKKLIKDLDLQQTVRFLQPVLIEELGEILAEADLGVVPKRGGVFSSEAFSTKILEFMAAGVPVIASRTKVDQYYFDDSMIMFFEPGNPDDLARCIVELANDKERQQSLTENGRRFSEINNWNDKQKVYYSILENLTGQSTATVPSLLNTKTRRKTNRVPIIQNADRPVVVLSTHNTGLGLIRSIGEAGLPVVAVYYDKNDMGYVSKYVVERVFTAHPEESEKQFIDTLVDLADRYGEGLLVPADDATLVTVSKNKDLLKQHYTVACTEWDTAQRFIDKKYTYELASSVGVPIPKTIVPKNINEAREYAESVDYPCLVKPCQSHLYHQLFRRKMRKVNNPEELISAYREASSAGLEVMLHEYIPGEDTEGVNYNSYCWDNQVLVEFTASKVRLSPPDSGVPAVVESKHIPEVAEYGRRVLKAMGYYGYSCTEFKRDTRDGVYKLMEVNGRHNRSLRLSVKCGINFPLIEYNHLVRGQLPKTADFRDGVFWIDVGGDLYCSFQYKRKRKLSLIDYLRPYVKPHIFAVLDLRDPMPIMKRLLNAPKSIFEKVFMH